MDAAFSIVATPLILLLELTSVSMRIAMKEIDVAIFIVGVDRGHKVSDLRLPQFS